MSSTPSSSDEFTIHDEDQLLMHSKDTLPDNCKKFWSRRHQLFSKHDEGIYMTSELWFSVTQENIALLTARIIKQLLPHATDILDICSGAGGNTIQFARYFSRVGTIDINPTNVYCTMHNCNIYGVKDRVWSITGDWLQLSQENNWIPQDIQQQKRGKFDFIFASPPWGGTNYNRTPGGFDLNHMEPLSLPEMCRSMKLYGDNFGLFLPKSSNRTHIVQMARELYGPNGQVKIIEVMTGGYCRGILVLFGDEVIRETDYEGLFDEDDSDYMDVREEEVE